MSGKTPPEKSPPLGVRGRVRVRVGIRLGLGSGRLFSGRDFFLEPLKEVKYFKGIKDFKNF